MIEFRELFNGVAVIIDDEIKMHNANISNILKQIESRHIPTLLYEKIPTPETIQNFQNLSFLLLDWEIIDKELRKSKSEGNQIPPAIIKSYEKENIDFIKKLKEVCFCPIFIFTNEYAEDIKTKLEKNGLYKNNAPNHIFVKSKKELEGRTKLFNEVKKWLTSNPSVYVLKEWEREYQKSKTKLFSDFQSLSPLWPKIMWKNFKDDSSNISLELGEFISRNLHTRMTPLLFSEEILNKKGKKIKTDEMRNVMEGERFLKKENLHDDNISPGDIFKNKNKYYLNIRPSCDLIPDRTKVSSSSDNVDLYLLVGSKLSDEKVKSFYDKKYGHFSEIDSQSIIFPLHEGKAIDFRFKNLEIQSWKELKEKHIGRILPPYITKIQQRYALYLQRQGLPRIPEAAIFDHN